MKISNIIITVFATLLWGSTELISSATIHTFAPQSVLSSGKWVKIRVSSSGIHKITAQDAARYGFSDLSKLKLYGYGGNPLEENFTKPKIDDLPEVPLFRENGALYFYALGPVKWSFKQEGSSALYVHTNNSYSFYGYYFLTEGENPALMPALESLSTTGKIFTSYWDYTVYEKDEYNFIKSGKEFYGEDFSSTLTQTFPFTIAGVTTDARARIEVDFAARVFSNTTLFSFVNNKSVSTHTLPISPVNYGYEAAKSSHINVFFTPDGSDKMDVKLQINKTGQFVGRLNYIRLNFQRNLTLYGSQTAFRNPDARTQISTFRLASSSKDIRILDITSPVAPKEVKGIVYGTSDQSFTIAASSQIQEFIAFDPNGSFASPELVGPVANQNLHGMNQVEFMIITHPDFYADAVTLANAHAQRDNLTTAVVIPEDIYNEFSSGTPDATAYRWFMKMFYERAQTVKEKPKYLLLYGEGTFDNRLVSIEWKSYTPSNKLLTYQASESLNETESYVTDDYFGFLADNTGATLASDLLDLGIGRFPVNTVQQSKEVLNKVLTYMSNSQLGSWKNSILYLADDGDNNLHVSQADQIARQMDVDHKEFMINKIYLDAFRQITTSTGETYPDANKKFSDLLKQGLLVLNYTGHGSTQTWSNEKLVTAKDIKSMSFSRLPLWVTATCDFSRFDDFALSAGELAFLNPKGGGIGLFTTTRVVYSSPNFELNKQFNQKIFAKNEDGTRYRLGDIMRETKRALCFTIVNGQQVPRSDKNKLNFILLGDPALTLAYPGYKARIDSFKHQPAANQGVLSALEEIHVSGSIFRPDSTFASDFNGLVYPTVFDAESKVVTFGNDQGSTPYSYKDRSNILFAGLDSVRSGKFSFTFIAPKDISYSNEVGRINIYASDPVNNNEAQGYYQNFLVGGTSSQIETDTVGPSIKMYLDSPDFVNGGKVGLYPTFIAHLEDKSGINTAGSGLGHDMVLIIDNKASKTYSTNSYYSSDIGGYTTGAVKYVIPDLSVGKHTLRFRVWDMQNNSSDQSLSFEVVDRLPARVAVMNVPNPVKTNTRFIITHDRPGADLNATIDLFDTSGRLVWSHQQNGLASMDGQTIIDWDLALPGGSRIPQGIYYYRTTIQTTEKVESSQTQKLIVVSQ